MKQRKKIKNSMKYVHYRHQNKQWYYWISERKQKYYFPSFLNYQPGKYETWFAGEETTNSKAKQILKEMFPEYEIIKPLPFHIGFHMKKR